MAQPPRTLPPVHPNIGIEAAYRRRLTALIDEMHRSILYWLTAAYRGYEAAADDLAVDAAPIPSAALIRKMRRLGTRWIDRFDKAAPEIAAHFAKHVSERSDAALAASLRKAGISVKFQTTPAIRNAMSAAVGENVGLIKTIAAQHFAKVEAAVLRSAAVGRDLHALTEELSAGYGVTKRRAAFIAKDQSNKMTAVVTKARQQQVGIKQAIWLHSAGGNKPRQEHVAFSGKKYDVEKGAYLEGVWTWPGHEINCRCVSKAILPALAGLT
jgi:uncharacterized protein with gpF-like domain